MQDWARIKDLVASALDVPSSQRNAWLDRACAPELRAEVDSLLAASSQGSEFIERAAFLDHRVSEHDTSSGAIDPLIGTRAGAYQIVSRIGEGGMGSVYRATRHDSQYQAQVAVKVLRRGISSEFIISRFRTERQILARLNHPNIASLLDGGTTEDGRPYFVMELIDGKPLDEFCDAQRLSTADRLQLFRQVCSAVQYAHSNLIVHRDLKPTNILVTADGVPKLLDFGIAKILGASDQPEPVQTTMAVVRLMTPDYAAPEQIRGENITTATDVYALGVILFELLTGHHPHRRGRKPAHELERMICDVDPERPSSAIRWVETVTDRAGATIVVTPEWVSGARDGRPEKLVRRLRGDLDNIVLKAMKKDPGKRYESAGQLAEDVRRHLDHEPVIARNDTVLYRGSKFFARHRTAVAAFAAVIVTMIAGGALTVAEWRAARVERARAERRFNDVRHLATSFLFEFHDAIRDLPGSTEARALVVRKALAYLDSLSREAQGDVSLQRELAEAYEKVADVQGNHAEANLGDTAGAARSIEKALALRETLAREHPDSVEDKMALASTYGAMGSKLGEAGDSTHALDQYQKAFRMREDVFAAHPGDLKIKRSLAVGYWEVGVGFADVGAFEDALKARLKSLSIFEELGKVKPTAANRRSVALLHKNVSATLNRLGRPEEALEHSRAAIAIDEGLLKEKPDDVQARKDVSFSYGESGENLTSLKRYREALDYYNKSLELRRQLAQQDSKDAQARYALASMEYRVGNAYLNLGDLAKALEHHQAALTIREQQASDDPASVANQVNVAESYNALGRTYVKLARQPLAQSSFAKGLGILEKYEAQKKLPPMYAGLLEKLRRDAAGF